jgi:hypothetical protein
MEFAVEFKEKWVLMLPLNNKKSGSMQISEINEVKCATRNSFGV